MSQENNQFLSNIFAPNFSEMTPQKADEAISASLSEANANIQKIESLQDDALAFENTIRALDRAALKLGEVWTIANHLESVNSSPEMRAVLNARDAAVTDFYSSIYLNEKLWKKIKRYADKNEKLPTAQSILRDETVKDFVKNGADLGREQKERLKSLNAKLASLTRKFGENSLDALNAFQCHVIDAAELKGLPEAALNLAAKKAAEKKLDGWLVTLDAPIFTPLMAYCENERLREKVWRAYSNLCDADAHDNTQIMRDIIKARTEKAEILGKQNFADFVLESRMAHDGKTALDFVESLRDRFLPSFKKDVADIEKFGGGKLAPWNLCFTAEKMRQKFYNFDNEALRPYFPLDKAMQGAFGLAKILFGLRIEKAEAPKWNESVMFFNVFNKDEKHIASFYADLFPRKGKRAGAWMNLLKDESADHPKLGLIAANFNEASNGTPSLLSHDELETLFHEFGHLVHFILIDAPEHGLRSVAWDFVELPSQIMENWTDKLEFLDTFAAHWKTGEKIPRDLFAKFDSAKKFRGASAAMRQLAFSKIDLELHMNPQKFEDGDIEALARETLKPYSQEYTETPHTILHHFTHIFGDSVGYAAGYYSYKWAEVLDADAFTRFEKEGIFNSQTGHDFVDKILRVGKTVSEAEAFKNFMGRDPDPEALVRKTI